MYSKEATAEIARIRDVYDGWRGSGEMPDALLPSDSAACYLT
jgi:hypothetical protein